MRATTCLSVLATIMIAGCGGGAPSEFGPFSPVVTGMEGLNPGVAGFVPAVDESNAFNLSIANFDEENSHSVSISVDGQVLGSVTLDGCETSALLIPCDAGQIEITVGGVAEPFTLEPDASCLDQDLYITASGDEVTITETEPTSGCEAQTDDTADNGGFGGGFGG